MSNVKEDHPPAATELVLRAAKERNAALPDTFVLATFDDGAIDRRERDLISELAGDERVRELQDELERTKDQVRDLIFRPRIEPVECKPHPQRTLLITLTSGSMRVFCSKPAVREGALLGSACKLPPTRAESVTYDLSRDRPESITLMLRPSPQRPGHVDISLPMKPKNVLEMIPANLEEVSLRPSGPDDARRRARSRNLAEVRSGMRAIAFRAVPAGDYVLELRFSDREPWSTTVGIREE